MARHLQFQARWRGFAQNLSQLRVGQPRDHAYVIMVIVIIKGKEKVRFRGGIAPE